MSKNLELKKQVVSDIVKKFQDAQSVMIVNYNGLTVEQVTGLRAQFRAAGVEPGMVWTQFVRFHDPLSGNAACGFGDAGACSGYEDVGRCCDVCTRD